MIHEDNEEDLPRQRTPNLGHAFTIEHPNVPQVRFDQAPTDYPQQMAPAHLQQQPYPSVVGNDKLEDQPPPLVPIQRPQGPPRPGQLPPAQPSTQPRGPLPFANGGDVRPPLVNAPQQRASRKRSGEQRPQAEGGEDPESLTSFKTCPSDSNLAPKNISEADHPRSSSAGSSGGRFSLFNKEKERSEPEKVLRRSNAYAAEKPQRQNSAPTSPVPFGHEDPTSYSQQNVRTQNTRK